MDALKIIAAESVKEQAPQFSVGDTVRVSVNIREGERENPAVRGHGHRPQGFRRRRNLHRPPCFLRRRRGESFPAAFPEREGRRDRPQGPRTPCEALLPARQSR